MDKTEYDNLRSFVNSDHVIYPSHLLDTTTKAARNSRQSYRKKAAKFFVKDNVLYRRVKGSINGVEVVCEDRRADILQEFHGSPLGGHSGVNKTISTISLRYWWFGLTGDVRNYIHTCEKCQKSDPFKPPQKPELQSIKVTHPFELVGIDLTGPLVETTSGNKYIFTATDYYTKWVEAFAIPSKSAVDVVSCIKKMIARHGAMNAILTDQGREFINQINNGLCDAWGIKHKVTAAYHPQTNGLDERTNQTIKTALRKLTNDHQNDWDDLLDSVLFSLRSKPQCSTRYSPFFLLYGREAVYPSSLPKDFGSPKDDGSSGTFPDGPSEAELAVYVEGRADTDITTKKSVQQNVEKAQSKQKATYEKAHSKRPYCEFSAGDNVLLHNSRNACRKGKADLKSKYDGPYTIESVDSKSVKLKNQKGLVLKKTYSIDRLKIYHSPTHVLPLPMESPEIETPLSTEHPEFETPVSTEHPELETPLSTKHPELETPVSTKHPELETPVSTEHPELETTVSTEHPELETPVSTEHPEPETPVSTEHPELETPVSTEHPELETPVSTEHPELETPVSTEHPELETPVSTKHPELETPVSTKHPELETRVSTKHPELETPVSTKHPELETPVSTEHPELETPVSTKHPELETPLPTERPAETDPCVTYVNQLVLEGTLDVLINKLATTRVPRANSVVENQHLQKTCPVFSLVAEISNNEQDMDAYVNALVPHLHNLPYGNGEKTELAMLIACVCHVAAAAFEPVLSIAQTLLNKPDHLDQVPSTDRPLQDAERLSIGGETVEADDMQSLNGDGWLTDKVVNAYLCLLKKEKNVSNTHVIVLPSYTAVMWNAGHVDHYMFKKMQFSLYRFILMPAVVRENHWILLVADVRNRTVTVLDSMNGQDGNHLFHYWRQFMNIREQVVPEGLAEWQHLPASGCNRQTDGHSCGVFVLMNAEAIVKDVPHQVMRQVHIPMYRTYVKSRLLHSGRSHQDGNCDMPECTARSGTRRWVQCAVCGRWLHIRCCRLPLKTALSDEDYECVFCIAIYR